MRNEQYSSSNGNGSSDSQYPWYTDDSDLMILIFLDTILDTHLALSASPSETTDDLRGSHHIAEEFAVRGKEPKDEVQIYTWRDATLRELTDLVKEVAPAARRRDAKLSFAFVYPDRRGRNVVRQVGVTYAYPNARRPDEGNKALADLSFQTGDFLDVAILT